MEKMKTDGVQMKTKSLLDAIELAQKTGFVLITTADVNGLPHVTAAGKINGDSFDHINVMDWFCPNTLANLRRNEYVSVVIWDRNSNRGFQLLGQLERITETSVMDGYSAAFEEAPLLPQIEKQILIHIDKILDFNLGPHSDMEK